VEKGWIFPPKALYRNRGLKNYHTYHQYVVRAKQRDDLQKFLKERGVPTAIYYPLSLHLQKCFAYLGYKEGDFPESEEASREVLALPVYPELNSHQQDIIVSSINQFYKKG
jgi:dTDP-4-amino-4,6-dideoxygalactose transaminase